jgi:hypothetical protein
MDGDQEHSADRAPCAVVLSISTCSHLTCPVLLMAVAAREVERELTGGGAIPDRRAVRGWWRAPRRVQRQSARREAGGMVPGARREARGC